MGKGGKRGFLSDVVQRGFSEQLSSGSSLIDCEIMMGVSLFLRLPLNWGLNLGENQV